MNATRVEIGLTRETKKKGEYRPGNKNYENKKNEEIIRDKRREKKREREESET